MSGECNEVNWRGVRPVSGIRGVWPARDSVRIFKNGSIIGLGETVIYTVPAAKLLFISGAELATGLSADADVRSMVSVRDALDAFQYQLFYHRFIVKGQLNNSQNYLPALEVPATWYVEIRSSGAGLNSTCSIKGWLEDA